MNTQNKEAFFSIFLIYSRLLKKILVFCERTAPRPGKIDSHELPVTKCQNDSCGNDELRMTSYEVSFPLLRGVKGCVTNFLTLSP